MTQTRIYIAGLADRYALKLGLVIVVGASLRMLTASGSASPGWMSWADQDHYFVSAQAWAHGKLDASLHHYPPGYSLMGAPFVRLLKVQAFAVPDLLCLMACLILFAALGRRLLPDMPGWRAACVAAFLYSTLSSPVLRNVWIVPWNTTGAAPFGFAALLATLRLCEAPGLVTAAVLGGLLGIMAGIRPTDAAILAVVCAAYAVTQLARAGLRKLLGLAGVGGAAICLGAAPLALAHLAVHGASGGDYLAKSANIGFEWRLLPLRWVTLVLDPHPLLPEGTGLAEALPWIGPGLAGLLLMTTMSGKCEREWRLIGAAIVLHWCLYLAYRDLQPYGLWRFYNLHYFKWTFPFLLLAALRLAAALARRRQRSMAILAVACAAPMLLWQPIGRREAAPASTIRAGGDGSMRLDPGLAGVSEALFLPLLGSWHDIYLGHATVTAGRAVYRNTWDFKLQPVAGGALLQPLRPFMSGPMTFQAATGTSLGGGDVVRISETLRLGLPCAILPWRMGCQTPDYGGGL